MKYLKKMIEQHHKERILDDLRKYSPPGLHFSSLVERNWPRSIAESMDGRSYLIRIPAAVRREDNRIYFWFFIDGKGIVFFLDGLFSNLIEFEYLPEELCPLSSRMKEAIGDSAFTLGAGGIGPGRSYVSVDFK